MVQKSNQPAATVNQTAVNPGSHRDSLIVARVNHDAITRSFAALRDALGDSTPEPVQAALAALGEEIDTAADTFEASAAIRRDIRYDEMHALGIAPDCEVFYRMTDAQQETLLCSLEPAWMFLTDLAVAA